MFSFLQADFEANQKMRELIESKLNNGITLTDEEQYFFCDNIHWEERSSLPNCEDVFYRDAFILRDDPTYGPYQVNYTPENERRFQQIVYDWAILMTTSRHTDTSMQAEYREVKKELKNLNSQFKISDPQYDDNYFKLMAWSKFRFLLIRKIFKFDIKADSYSLWLNGEEIIFDYDSCTHIVARHFAYGMKPYVSGKDHFYGVFRHMHLHQDFEQIFEAIDSSGLYLKESILDITFRYKGELYKIFTMDKVYGSVTKKRISTFFPISDSNILSILSSDYNEKKLSDELSVFVKNGTP